MPIEPMLFGPGHPIVDRKDWLAFSSQLSISFSRGINREHVELPFWMQPLALGVILPSPHLLRQTGYSGPQPGWRQLSAEVYHRALGKTRLRVRRTNDGKLWLISRWLP